MKRRCFRACRCAKKRNNTKEQITLDEDFITQPFLKLYAKLKGNTHASKKTHAEESGTRHFEKEIWGSVSVCLEQKVKQSHRTRISSSNHFCNYMPQSREILMQSKNRMLTKVGHGILKRRFWGACRCA